MCASPARNWTDDDGNNDDGLGMRVTEKGGARQAKTVRDGMICRGGFIHTNRGVCSGQHP